MGLARRLPRFPLDHVGFSCMVHSKEVDSRTMMLNLRAISWILKFFCVKPEHLELLHALVLFASFYRSRQMFWKGSWVVYHLHERPLIIRDDLRSSTLRQPLWQCMMCTRRPQDLGTVLSLQGAEIYHKYSNEYSIRYQRLCHGVLSFCEHLL